MNIFNKKGGKMTKKAPKMTNKGYGEAGASKKKRVFKAFTAKSGSPQEDIDKNNYTLRQRGRMLYMSSPVATSAVKTHRTNTIGIGLRLNPKIDARLLGLSIEEAAEWKRIVKKEFDIWAAKKQHCDATKMNDFYSMQQLAFSSWLTSGDVFVLKKQGEVTKMNPYSLRLHIIEADRCSTPRGLCAGAYLNTTKGTAQNGNAIFDGVEIDKDGAVEAFYFSNYYPDDVSGLNQMKWTRVEAYGKETGLPNVCHIMTSERPDQYRGVTLLAQIIEPILQIRRYTESEIEAALIESFYTAFISTDADASEMPFNDIESDEDVPKGEDEYQLGPGTVNILEPGESVTFGDPKRPASGFDGFVNAVCKQMGSALEIPADLLLKQFNASYSASRAALMEAWKSFKMYRDWFTNDMLKPIYEMWLSEAIARGRVSAPGFFENPIVRQAYLNSEWVGPSQGQLDPVKEIQAEVLAVQNGFTTREAATIKLNGGDFYDNVDLLIREQEVINELKQKESEGNNG